MLVDTFKAPITSTSMNRDASCSLISLLDSSLHLVDLESGRSLISFKGHLNTKYRLCPTFSRSEASVVSGSEDGAIYIWDVLSGNVTAKTSGTQTDSQLCRVASQQGCILVSIHGLHVAFVGALRMVCGICRVDACNCCSNKRDFLPPPVGTEIFIDNGRAKE